MKSLFIISLPRSLSTEVHTTCCAALGLHAPAWTSAGEIMNLDRSVLFAGTGSGGLKFTTPEHAATFGPAEEFLSQVVQPAGFCYKDVVQPFVVSHWLRQNRDMAVLKILPNVAHVAFAMLSRSWLYPSVAAVRAESTEGRMVAGLLRAARAIASVPGEAVLYDDLVTGTEPLRRALARLYPDVEVPPLAFGPDFEASRERVLQRRTQDGYLSLQRLEREMTGTGRIAA